MGHSLKHHHYEYIMINGKIHICLRSIHVDYGNMLSHTMILDVEH